MQVKPQNARQEDFLPIGTLLQSINKLKKERAEPETLVVIGVIGPQCYRVINKTRLVEGTVHSHEINTGQTKKGLVITLSGLPPLSEVGIVQVYAEMKQKEIAHLQKAIEKKKLETEQFKKELARLFK